MWLEELLSRFQAGSSISGATEWLVDEPAPFRIARETGRGELRCIVHRSHTDLIAVVIGVFASAGPAAGEPGGNAAREHGLEGRMRKVREGYEFAFSYGDVLPQNGAPSQDDTLPKNDTLLHHDTPVAAGTTALELPAVTEALRQLEAGLEKYVRVLAGFRGDYIHPLRITSRGEVMHLSRSVDETKRREEIRQKQDEFLDAYIDWKATHRMAERTKLLELARELSNLDPSFQFSTPD